ncbi:DUF11 domain-containing protein [Occultella gossypii]|uniref:PD40 domain-containing protein n=1 Tax=Occultella gossypii TaxID=2800820 RepID=A0ABS7SAX7_9MICO|nr:DUF11 domain-containing protein [Occultella gossypii]MBZ2197038.1 PD40 domain-containing protein [Occultella gossypii]
MARTLAVTAALGLLAPAAVAAVPMPPITADLPAPDAASTRVAFTERGGGLGQAAWSVGTAGSLPDSDVERLSGREGDSEYSVVYVPSAEQAVSSFVRTDESGVGDVYVQVVGTDAPVRITCDDARVSHPVVSPNGQLVAYATSVDDGPWRIAVASIGDPPCEGGMVEEVPGGDGDDLWPSWLPSLESNDLVFSSTRDDPLGDIYLANLGSKPALWRITSDPAADTQPSVGAVGNGVALAFATTRYRADGSVALVDLFAASPEELEDQGEIFDPWSPFSFAGVQGSEPAWGLTQGEWPSDAVLLITSTSLGPYGDIIDASVSYGGEGVGAQRFDFEYQGWTFGDPLVPNAESHAAWTDPPAGGSGPPEIDTVVTASMGSADSNLGDVDARTGSGRRVSTASIPDADDADPAYSPDGSWLVFSSEAVTEDGRTGSRLMLAAADGSVTYPLNYAWDPGEPVPPGTEFPGDLRVAQDINPTWSPDGTRIAFERLRHLGEEYDRQVLVADFVPGAGGPGIPVATTTPVTDTSAEWYVGEPDWSPDGRYLVGTSGMGLVLIDPETTDPANSAIPLLHYPEGCLPESCSPSTIEGRAPTWSPDGTTIAVADAYIPTNMSSAAIAAVSVPFDVRGGIALITLDPEDPTAPFIDAVPVVGFDDEGVPTASRLELSAATDPAWSSDGSEIYLAGKPAGLADDWGIYAVRPDGEGLREVAQGPGPETEPTVQPDVDLSLTMAASPNVVPVGGASELTLTVRNEGQRPVGTYRVLLEVPAELQLGEPPPGCTLDDLILTCLPTEPIGPLGVSILTLTVLGRVPGTTAEVTAVVLPGGPDRDAGNNRAATSITITGSSDQQTDLDLTLAVSPPTGYVGGQPMIARITVTNNGPAAITSATVTTGFPAGVVPTALNISSTAPDDLAPPVDLTDPATVACLTGAGSCPIGPLLIGDSVVLEASLLPVGPEGTGQLTATVALEATAAHVDVDPTNDAATAVVSVLQPEIRLLPSVARPGDAVLAYGEDFPPGQAVMLTWSQGITVNPGPYVVSAEGRLVIPLVLVSRDLLGERDVIATSPAGAFGEVRGPLLVVARSIQAPNFLFRG